METLRETGYELNQLLSDQKFRFGLHMGDQIVVGQPGIKIGEIPFDPLMHEAEHIDPLSTMEMMTDMPYVAQVIPFRPLELNVVLHRDVRDRDLPDVVRPIGRQKFDLAVNLIEALNNSAPIGDTANMYVVGDTENVQESRDLTVVKGTETDKAASEAVAELCLQGLTFVVSNFESLKLPENKPAFAKTVAVKANHKLELAIPDNVGDWQMDGRKTVNTNNSKKLAKENEAITRKHQAVIDGLRRSGLIVATVAFDNQLSQGFDMAAADKSLAGSLKELGRR
jgi:hypothetical protein